MPNASEKFLDFVQHRILVAHKGQMILTGELDELRTRNPGGHVSGTVDA